MKERKGKAKKKEKYLSTVYCKSGLRSNVVTDTGNISVQ